MDTRPSFRVIAIAGGTGEVTNAMRAAAHVAPIPIGLMLRDRAHDAARVRMLADRVHGALPGNVQLIVNGATYQNAEYVHLPFAQHALCDSMRSLGLRVGVSVHSASEASAAASGFDYVMCSPVFATPSKPGHPGIGLDALAEICDMLRCPVFALGGIDARTATACLDAGAYGVAGISAFNDEQDAVDLIHAVEHGTNSHARL